MWAHRQPLDFLLLSFSAVQRDTLVTQDIPCETTALSLLLTRPHKNHLAESFPLFPKNSITFVGVCAFQGAFLPAQQEVTSMPGTTSTSFSTVKKKLGVDL